MYFGSDFDVFSCKMTTFCLFNNLLPTFEPEKVLMFCCVNLDSKCTKSAHHIKVNVCKLCGAK